MLNFKDPQMKQLFSQSELYFNAGVFVADLDKWRERKLSEEMIKWLTINADHNIYQVRCGVAVMRRAVCVQPVHSTLSEGECAWACCTLRRGL
jgi:hypothetical protein